MIRIRDVKREPVGEHADRPGQGKVAPRERLLIDSQVVKPPRAKMESLQPELQHAFQKTVARLQMLRCEKRSLRPDDWLQLAHLRAN